jgi:hypothetical protein
MPYLASWRHRRCSTISAVPRQSFVIHPNGGWWQSNAVYMTHILRKFWAQPFSWHAPDCRMQMLRGPLCKSNIRGYTTWEWKFGRRASIPKSAVTPRRSIGQTICVNESLVIDHLWTVVTDCGLGRISINLHTRSGMFSWYFHPG